MTEYRLTTFEDQFRIESRESPDGEWLSDNFYENDTLESAVRSLRALREDARVAAADWHPVPEALITAALAAL